MAVSNLPTFTKTPKLGLAQILPADTTTKKTLVTAGADGSKVTGITASNTETASGRVLQIWITRAGTDYLVSSASVPLNSGFDGTVPPVNMFSLISGLPVDNDGQKYLFLVSGDVLKCNLTSTIAAAKECDVTAVYADF